MDYSVKSATKQTAAKPTAPNAAPRAPRISLADLAPDVTTGMGVDVEYGEMGRLDDADAFGLPLPLPLPLAPPPAPSSPDPQPYDELTEKT